MFPSGRITNSMSLLFLFIKFCHCRVYYITLPIQWVTKFFFFFLTNYFWHMFWQWFALQQYQVVRCVRYVIDKNSIRFFSALAATAEINILRKSCARLCVYGHPCAISWSYNGNTPYCVHACNIPSRINHISLAIIFVDFCCRSLQSMIVTGSVFANFL